MKATIPGLTDSRGNKSKTLFFVSVAFAAITIKFFLAGMTIPHLGPIATMGAPEYAGAVFGVMLPWVAREFKQKQLEAGGWTPGAPSCDAGDGGGQ